MATGGASREWDAQAENINCGSDSSLDNIFATGGSVVLWGRAESYGSGGVYGRYITKGGLGWMIYNYEDSGSRRFEFLIYRDTDYDSWDSSVYDLSANTWFHIACIFDESDGAGTAVPTCYVNGALETMNSRTSGTGGFASDAAIDLLIGNRTGSDRGFDGQIAHVSLYTKELTAAEVQTLMYKPNAIVDSRSAYWPLWGVDSPELDLSGNGNSGTVTGASVSTDGPPIFI